MRVFFLNGLSFLSPLVALLVVCGAAAQNYDRNLIGVAFGPYTDASSRARNSYTRADIQAMLDTIGRKFNHVSTYGMGVTGTWCKSGSWEKCDSEALIAEAAAELNKKRRSNRFQVNIGVYQRPANLLQQEIDSAFLAAQQANKISAGTVWGVTFTNEYVDNEDKARQVLDMINKNKGRNGLKVGTRLTTFGCGAVGKNDGFGRVMTDIIKNSDFVYCNAYPSPEHANLGPARAAEELGNYVLGLYNQIKGVNPRIDFRIGETGWPSGGRGRNDNPPAQLNTVANLLEYWKGINAYWKRQNTKIQTQMFEAFDEPYKADGDASGEAKFGLWYKSGNSYVEKKA